MYQIKFILNFFYSKIFIFLSIANKHAHKCTNSACDSLTTKFIDFSHQLDLFQSVSSLTRGTNSLFLLFTPKQFKCISSVKVIAPEASSDHSDVLVKLAVATTRAELNSFLKLKLLPPPNLKKM